MPTPSPADWYADPFGRHERRHWDGSRWTEHVSSRGLQAVDPPVDARPVSIAVFPQSPADWYPDPFGRHERRYWNGSRWTENVASRGVQAVDPPVDQRVGPTVNRPKKKVERQVRGVGAGSGQAGGGTVFTEQVLVVNQKAKLIGNKAEYAVYDQQGRQVSAVREVGRGIVSNAVSLRPVQNRTRNLQVVDLNGRVVIALTRPANIVKSKVIVRDANGAEVGQIVQKNIGILGKVRFGLESRGRSLGSINAESWNAWDFNIQDATGSEIARITKTWAGWAKERFTKADNYVVQIHRPLEEPLRSLVIAAALALDVALKQGEQTRGSSLWGTRRYE